LEKKSNGSGIVTPTSQQMADLKKIMEESGLTVSIGG
jgi:hypothetical protein